MTRTRLGIAAASTALLVAWAGWWGVSLARGELAAGSRTWLPVLPSLAADFVVHVDHTSRIYMAGENPYIRESDWVCAVFPYPPMVVRAFGWVALTSTPAAALIWQGTAAAMLAAGAFGAYRARARLGLAEVPLPTLLAATLLSTPAMFALERGQVDPVAIPALTVGAWLIGRRTPAADLAAGGWLGIAAWVKYYPGLAVLALAAFGRTRAVVAFVVVAGAIGAYDRTEVLKSVANGRAIAKQSARYHPIHPTQHSLVEDWPSLGFVRGFRPLRRISPPLGAAVLLIPAVAAVCLSLRRADPRALGFPAMLWLAAAATFAMPYSNDYNLAVLPLAALCVWDRRDPIVIHMVIGLLVLWWQPIAIPVGGDVLLVVKLLGLYAAAWSLILRAEESTRPAASLRGPHRVAVASDADVTRHTS